MDCYRDDKKVQVLIVWLYKPCRNLFGLWLYSLVQVCKNEKDDDSATRRKEMELAEEEDFGNNLVQNSIPESIEWFKKGPGFLAVVWFGSSLTLSPLSSVSKIKQRHTGKLRKRDNFLTGEEGMGWTRSRIIRPQDSLVIYKLFNTLCSLWLNSKIHRRREVL
jgi:hypothetical protein